MDKAFMEEYYDLKYKDTFLPLAMQENGSCENLYKEIMQMEEQTESIMRSMGEECLLLHRKLFVARGELEEMVMRLAYLQGAEDRDKMLR